MASAGAFGATARAILAALSNEFVHLCLFLRVELAILIHVKLLNEALAVRLATRGLSIGGGRIRLLRSSKRQDSKEAHKHHLFHGMHIE